MSFYGYDPSKYMKDFSWIGKMGSIIAQQAYKMPELIELNRSIKENANHTTDLKARVDAWVGGIMENPDIRDAMAANYGLENPQKLGDVLQGKFRSPKRKEDPGKYTMSVAKSYDGIMKIGGHGLNPAMLGKITSSFPANEVNKNVWQQFNRSKDDKAYKDYFSKVNEGVIVDKNPMTGQTVSKRPHTSEELRNLAVNYGHNTKGDLIINPKTDPHVGDIYNAASRADGVEKLRVAFEGTDPSWSLAKTEKALALQGISNDVIRMHLGAMYKDRQMKLTVRGLKGRPVPRVEDVQSKGLKQVDAQLNTLRDDMFGLEDDVNKFSAKGATKEDKMAGAKKNDELSSVKGLVTVYTKAKDNLLKNPQTTPAQAVSSAQQEFDSVVANLETIAGNLKHKWEQGDYKGFALLNPFTWGKGDDLKLLEAKAAESGLIVTKEGNKIKITVDRGNIQLDQNPLLSGGAGRGAVMQTQPASGQGFKSSGRSGRRSGTQGDF